MVVYTRERETYKERKKRESKGDERRTERYTDREREIYSKWVMSRIKWNSLIQ